jgi:sugar O-acyltransferase (sialic acid O-acetyltransferase NeuD family)
MEPASVIIVGAGGFGREVLDVIEAINAANDETVKMLGFVDDGAVNEQLLERRGTRLLGPISLVPSLGCAYIIGIGGGAVRHRIADLLAAAGCRALTVIHPAATLGGDNHLGEGCVLTAGTRVTNNVTLGRHVHLNINSTVGHDTVIGDHCSVFPGATLSGNVTMGAGVTIGTGANVLPGITIGEGAFVGAGAVVTKDVEPGATVVGSPARPLGSRA